MVDSISAVGMRIHRRILVPVCSVLAFDATAPSFYDACFSSCCILRGANSYKEGRKRHATKEKNTRKQKSKSMANRVLNKFRVHP